MEIFSYNSTMKASLRAFLFGTFEIHRDEVPLTLSGSGRARSLLAYLCLYQSQPISRPVLAGTFWPEQSENAARRALSQALWHIRRAIPDLITSDAHTVHISPEQNLWVDAAAFQALIEKFHQKSTPAQKSMNALHQATQLYRGDLLNGFYDEWIFVERESLREQYLQILELLIHLQKSSGRYTKALEYGRQLLQADPLRERIYRSLMQVNLALGRPEAALRIFEDCQQTMHAELGIEPEPETIALAREIQTHSDTVQIPYLPPKLTPTTPLLEDSHRQFPLVGRESERRELVSCLDGIFEHRGGTVLVEGEAGVGKTRLLQEAMRDAEWRGAQTLLGGCREIEGMAPYQPLVEAVQNGLSPLRCSQLAQLLDNIWLRVLTSLIPGLGRDPEGAPPSAVAPDRGQDRLKIALTQLFTAWAQITPVVLSIEDIHWAGADLLEMLATLAVRLREQRVLILLTYRSEEARANPEQWRQIQNLDKAGPRGRLQLTGLDAGGSGELIRRALHLANPAPLFEERIHHETGGNPLFLLETLRALLEENILTQDANGNWHTPWDETTADYGELPTPPAVENIIARRLKNMDPQLEQVLHQSAVLGEFFDFSLLQTVSKMSLKQLLPKLGELVRRRFLLETEEQYGFSHARVREVIYAQIPALLRRSYHQNTAEALEKQGPDQVAQLAHHYYQAQIWEKNLHYSQLAGDQAAGNYANHEALSHYSRALELIPVDRAAERYALLLAREKIYNLLGQREAQAQELAALTKIVQKSGSPQQKIEFALRKAKYAEGIGDFAAAATEAQTAAELADKNQLSTLETESRLLWGGALRRLGQYDAAKAKLQQALEMAQHNTLPKMEADSLRALSILYAYQSEFAMAQDHALQALSIYEETGDLPGQGDILNILGVQLDYQTDYQGAKNYYEQALQIKRCVGDRRGEADALLNIGVAIASLGDNASAAPYYHQALAIYQQIGSQQGENWALGNLGSLATELGDYRLAQEYFEQSLANCQKIGDRQGECAAYIQICTNLCLQGIESAQQYGQQALEIALELNDLYLQSYAYTYLGEAYANAGHLADASQAYQKGYEIRKDLEEFNLSMEALAGLANITLKRGKAQQASSYVAEILDYLKTGTLDGCDEPIRVYLTCYRVLEANHDPRAAEVLEAGYTQLQERADRITDDEMRRSFLENITYHRELIAAYREWQEQQRGQSVRVRLPKIEAPTGRPLREDEWVEIHWTPEKPGDEVYSKKQEQRQHRLLRLLGEAQTQGGAPTLGDLSEALGASIPTLKRDLAALRKMGHTIQTRGSRSS